MPNSIRNKRKKRIAVVIGTRPEAVKLAPIIKALMAQSDNFEPIVIVTAQHRQMLDQVLSIFAIRPDVDLGVMVKNQTLNGLTAKVLALMEDTLSALRPDLLLVQGDTTTAFASALAAFNLKIPVGHVEAGLRSHNLYNPFPEEINRRLTSNLTAIHFAPTARAMQHLCAEGVARERIAVTGNTVVDSVGELLNVPFAIEGSPLHGIEFQGKRTILVTSHRRESWGHDLESICFAIRDVVERFDDIQVVFPVHMNPQVSATVFELLGSIKRVKLTEPLDYLTFINLMKRCFMILTDSGGIQEEAPTMRKPLLVLRNVTERPEAFLAGLAKIVGTSRQAIVAEASHLLSETKAYNNMLARQNPYGDGHAAERIITAITRWAHGRQSLLSESEEFNEAQLVTVHATNRELQYVH